jgi:hypothetical protein
VVESAGGCDRKDRCLQFTCGLYGSSLHGQQASYGVPWGKHTVGEDKIVRGLLRTVNGKLRAKSSKGFLSLLG